MNVLVYLLQVTACTAVFYLFYYLFLRRLTFFITNRWYLLGTLIISFAIPLLTIKTSEPHAYVGVVEQAVYVYAPPTFIADIPITQPEVKAQPINWMQILKFSYLIAVTALTLHLIFTLIAFFKRLKGKQITKIGNVNILTGNSKIANGSFLNYIFLNEQELSADEIQQIIAHELLHVKRCHSVDRIIVRIAQIILWFNPFIYLYTRAVEENHEFEVDREITRSTDKQNYANLLLHLSVAGQGMLYHNFSKVPLKKRITMLFNQPSNHMKKTIYLLIVPVVLISCLAFAKVKNDNFKFNTIKNVKTVNHARLSDVADSTKYRQKIKRTPQQEKQYKKGYEAFKVFQKSDEYKNKLKLTQELNGKTITVKLKDYVDYKTATGFSTKGFLIDYKGNDILLNVSYKDEKPLNTLLAKGDEINLKISTSFFSKDKPVFISPLYIIKNHITIYKAPEAGALADYPFLYEANKVRFADARVSHIEKHSDGRWKSAVFETVNGYQFSMAFKASAPDFSSISEGSKVRLRFVHEVKTGAKTYQISDWVSITTDIKNYGIKNPDLFNKFYEATAMVNNPAAKNNIASVMSAEDSTYFDKKNQITNLYGNAHVKHGDFDVTADYIRIDDKNHLIFAAGRLDNKTNRYTGKINSTTGKNQSVIADSIQFDYANNMQKIWGGILRTHR